MAVISTQQPAPEQRQADKAEAAPIEASKEVSSTPEEEQLSPKFAALARKEKALRSKYQELKTLEESLKAKQSEYEQSYIPKAKLKDLIQQDPLRFMNENGLSYDQLTQLALNHNPQDAHIQKLQAKIEELEQKQNKTVENLDTQQKQAYERAVTQIRTDAEALINSDPSYEAIKESGSVEAVVELIKETFDKEGTLLSIEDAAKEVEDYLVEEFSRTARLKKVQQKLAPAPEVEAQKSGPQVTQKLHPATTTMKTLTNAQAAPSRPLTAKERRERAILAFQGQLTN